LGVLADHGPHRTKSLSGIPQRPPSVLAGAAPRMTPHRVQPTEVTPMSKLIRKSAATVAVLSAFGLGGAAIAGAAGSGRSSTTKQQRAALSSETAAKVKAAALDKVPGATVLRTEAGGPYSTPYHAHVKTSDGTLKVVLVDKDFEATEVQADRGRGRGGPGG